MTLSCPYSKISATFVLQKRVTPKMMTRKIGHGIPNEINKPELDYMEHDYMRIKGHKRCHGTSRNLKVMIKSHMMLFHMVKIVKKFMY